jgi:hypothetical protein
MKWLFCLLLIMWSISGAIFYGGANEFCVKPSLTIVVLSGPLVWIFRFGDYLRDSGEEYQRYHVNWDTGETK